jgi:phage shock protein C
MAKRLYRSQKDKVIAGICGGIAEYFNIDPVIIRVIAVLLLLPGGLPGIVPYIIMWIIIPKKPGGKEATDVA